MFGLPIKAKLFQLVSDLAYVKKLKRASAIEFCSLRIRRELDIESSIRTCSAE
jgi:hypothetical protein